MSSSPLVTRLEGPAPESQIARDLVRRGVIAAPVLVAVSALFWRLDGVLSCLCALAIVLANFMLAATAMSVTARISLVLMMGVSLFGYIVRLALILLVYVAIHNMTWFSAPAFGFTIIVAHLGLLLWEVRQVSATLAFPGLKPRPPRRSATHSTR
jgi:hypothetical protein